MNYLYKEIASSVDSRRNCVDRNLAQRWVNRHEDRINNLINEHMPSGAGIDSGVSLDLGASTGERLVFTVPYHTMDEHGYYDGWVTFTVTVTPSLLTGLTLEIKSDSDDSTLDDYIADVMIEALETEL